MTAQLANSRPAVVLLAEDNDHDVELMQIAFERSKVVIDLHRVKDGEECMAFLQRRAPYSDAPVPDLLLLDLNMPRKSGQEVMAEIAEDPALRHIPVAILTSSADQQEILKMYKLRCSAYIVKPVDLEGLTRVVKQLADYWFTIVVLPSAARQGGHQEP
jgi:two-component system, chemotaxis family, response regulator Rcp1